MIFHGALMDHDLAPAHCASAAFFAAITVLVRALTLSRTWVKKKRCAARPLQ
jgi:hypothetical protein